MQFFLDFIKQIKRIFTVAVHFVDKHNHRSFPHAAYFHQFTRLSLDTFRYVNHDDDTIYGCQCSECILSEILVTRCIQNVNLMVGIIECHDRGSYRDTTLFLDFHPVGRCRLFDLVRFYCPCHMNGTSEKQQLLGQGCLTGIRVTDNRKCSSSFNFFGVLTHFFLCFLFLDYIHIFHTFPKAFFPVRNC